MLYDIGSSFINMASNYLNRLEEHAETQDELNLVYILRGVVEEQTGEETSIY